MKVYIVLYNSYSNCEYYDVATWVDKVFTTKEKALAYIESIDGIRHDDVNDRWVIGDEDVDPYAFEWYVIEEEEVI